MENFPKIEQDLISEIKLSTIEAKVFLLVTTRGQLSVTQISELLKLNHDEASLATKNLISFGAFIDISENEYEAMHPRFTVVNMYRKFCERENIEFKRNKIIDQIGVILERPYEKARTG